MLSLEQKGCLLKLNEKTTEAAAATTKDDVFIKGIFNSIKGHIGAHKAHSGQVYLPQILMYSMSIYRQIKFTIGICSANDNFSHNVGQS